MGTHGGNKRGDRGVCVGRWGGDFALVWNLKKISFMIIKIKNIFIPLIFLQCINHIYK
jgi:hypothetical protein